VGDAAVLVHRVLLRPLVHASGRARRWWVMRYGALPCKTAWVNIYIRHPRPHNMHIRTREDHYPYWSPNMHTGRMPILGPTYTHRLAAGGCVAEHVGIDSMIESAQRIHLSTTQLPTSGPQRVPQA
jgi:hypothetical protein